MSEHASGTPADPPEFRPEDLARRANEYVELWQRARTRLVADEYHAEDLVEDWFTLWGKVVRDTVAAAALTWRLSGARRYASEEDSRPEPE